MEAVTLLFEELKSPEDKKAFNTLLSIMFSDSSQDAMSPWYLQKITTRFTGENLIRVIQVLLSIVKQEKSNNQSLEDI
jgi:hypothetical protein